ncbi:hypothetical protein LguiA_020905 [Lonicera macranthoides]
MIISTTAIHIMALDGIVNVNSLFTLALFLGLTSNPTDPTYTLVDPNAGCAAGSAVAEALVACHVYSFGSFLFSSLVATGLKLAIREGGECGSAEARGVARVNARALRVGILASAVGSGTGCVFLTLALVDLVQIKLGVLGCGGLYSVAAVGPLVVLVPSALTVYICIVLYAFTR